MQLQNIFICTVLLCCIRVHIRAIPVQQNEASRNENNRDTKVRSPANSPTCYYSSDCPAHSQCVSGICECVKGWMTWKTTTLCSYEQKSKWTAFLLSFFVGYVGVDWFYLARGAAGHIMVGVVKLLMFSCVCTLFLMCFVKDSESSNSASLYPCINFLLSIWWLVDWIRILVDKLPDGNDAPLYAS